MESNLFVLTGPPCSGKTKILAELKKLGFSVVQEAQIHTIAHYKEKLGESGWKSFIRNPDGTINKPNFFRFMQDCLKYQIWQEEMMKDTKKPTILDRSAIDCLSFLELRSISNIQYTRMQISEHVRSIGGFAGVFDLSLLQSQFEKRKQEGRVITLAEAEKFGEINTNTYRQYGYTSIEFLSRKDAKRDAKSIREAVYTVLLGRA